MIFLVFISRVLINQSSHFCVGVSSCSSTIYCKDFLPLVLVKNQLSTCLLGPLLDSVFRSVYLVFYLNASSTLPWLLWLYRKSIILSSDSSPTLFLSFLSNSCIVLAIIGPLFCPVNLKIIWGISKKKKIHCDFYCDHIESVYQFGNWLTKLSFLTQEHSVPLYLFRSYFVLHNNVLIVFSVQILHFFCQICHWVFHIFVATLNDIILLVLIFQFRYCYYVEM